LRFLYHTVLGRDWQLFDLVRCADHHRLPMVLTRERATNRCRPARSSIVGADPRGSGFSPEPTQIPLRMPDPRAVIRCLIASGSTCHHDPLNEGSASRSSRSWSSRVAR
jgi:hypothetical protein